MARVSHDDGATWVDYSTIDQAFANADDWGTNSIVELLGDCVLGNTFTFTGINAAGSSPFNLTIRKAGSLTDNPTLGAFATISDSYIVFSPAFGGSLTVEGIDFLGHGDNSSTTTDGGIFRITNGTASFSGCKFTDCQARNGGAISHDSSGDLTVTNSQFYSCQCTDFGGAIYTVSANATVTGCDFRGIFDENNPLLLFQTVTTKEGGAICHTDTNGSMTVTNTNISGFYCETGGSKGGGVFSSGLLTLDNVTISHCAAYYGGGVYSLSESTENAVTLKNGTSITGNMLYEGEFTVIMPNNDPVTLSNNRLDAAGVYMTGIIVLGDVNNENDTITISGNTTESGKPSDLRLGTDNGLGLRVRSNLGTKEGKGKIFIANPSGNGIKFGQDDIGIGGTAAAGSYDPKDVFKSNVTNRDAIRTNVNELYWRSYVCKITDANGDLLNLYISLSDAVSVFTSVSGAANIEMLVPEHSAASRITIPKTMTLKTAAKMWGPDTYGFPMDAAEDRATIKRNYYNNSLFYIDNVNLSLTIENITLEGKYDVEHPDWSGGNYGGLIYVGNGTLNIKGCNLQYAFAGNGGAIWINNGNLTISEYQYNDGGETVTRPTIFENCRSGRGAAICNLYASVNVTNTRFINCNSLGTNDNYSTNNIDGGGAFYCYYTNKPVVFRNCIFENCTSQNYGGAIYAKPSLTLENCSFSECSSTNKDGGAVYCISQNFVVKNTSFTDCTAGRNGGGLYYGAGDGTVTFDGITFNRCKATTGAGGGIWLVNSCSLTLYNTQTIKNCEAKTFGGGLYLNNATSSKRISLSDFYIEDCEAETSGGGIFMFWKATMTSCTIKGCRATGNNGCGGGIGAAPVGTSTSNDLILVDCNILNNMAKNQGGGILADKLTLQGSTRVEGNSIDNTTVANGGGVYVTDVNSNSSPSCKLYIGTASKSTNSVTIMGNTTSDGKQSNLRLPMSIYNGNQSSWSSSIYVNNEMNGSIGVCNPGAEGTQLGSQTSANLNDPSGLAHIFSDINDLEAHTKDNTSSGQKQIVWRNEAVCKITDSNGNLLTYNSDVNAVFYSLREAFEALGSAIFSATPACVKMLRDYAMKKQVSINASMPYDITLTTAGTNSETEGDYRYTGTGTRATLYRGSVSTTEWMFSILGTGASGHSFTLDNITIDGSASNDFTWGGMLSVSNARFVIGNATLQNIKHKGQAFDHGTWTETDNGYSPIHCVSSNVTITNGALFDNLKSTSWYGALYLGSSTLTMTGGTFQNCSTTGIGGAIYCYNSTLNITGGEITGCSASRGGAIYCDAGSTLNLKGGEITGCSTTGDGGGIYMANYRDSYQSYLLSTLNVSGLVKVYGNTKGAAKDGAANNVFLDELGEVKITDELACGSSIGVSYPSGTNLANKVVATGSEANCLDAFRKGYFFEDSQNYKPYCFNYGSFTADNIYLIKSWSNLADESGISVDGNTITVNTAAGLAYIAKQVNEGNDYQGKTILLANDLNLGSGTDGKLWVPIGNIWEGCTDTETNTDNDAIKPFRGTFDGQGHTITGLTSYLPHKAMGLFGVVGASGEVKNVFIEGGTINATYVPEADESAYVGGLGGMLAGGTVAYSESAATLASNVGDVAMGGLVGTVINSGTIHSSMAMPSMTISSMTGNIQVGGLVGDNGGHVANSFANASIAVTGDVVETGGLVGLNTGTIDNCYARLRGTAPTNFGWIAGTNSGTISNSYIPYVEGAEAPTGCSYYTPTNLDNDKYGFGSKGQEVGSSTLVDLLNANATGTYAKWTRTMASPINGDYPVLKLGDNICLGSKTGSNFIEYGSNLNDMITNYNNANGGNIYLYDVPTTALSTSTNNNVRVYIPEDFGILQGDGNTLNARAGVTVRNASGNAKEGASASWHMFSSAISNAPLGLVYHTSEDNEYMSEVANNSAISDAIWSNRSEFDPPMTTWNTTAGQIGYFPTNTPYGTWRDEPATTGFFDLYAYSEENYHWMNLKREGRSGLYDHWHTDRDDSGNHPKISYTNGTTMPAGKGYLLALSEESMLMADGVLNNGTKTVTVTKSEPSANVPSTRYTPDESKFRSINLVGNPYQSYLDFDAFAAENTMLENMYATRSGREYIYYTADASANGEYTASQYVHPHQGFFVRVKDTEDYGTYTVTFGNTMRLAGTSEQYSSPYRGQVNYPLVNLLCFDAEGHRDLTTVEVNRPEQGGGHKMEGLRTAEGTLSAQLGTELFQTAFVPEGTNEVPVRFEAYSDGEYTIRWNTLHGEFSYLHLIDNMTGADVDCLAAGEYTFEGKTTDYTSRFKLVFSVSQDEDENDDDEAFAFFNGSEWVITNGNGATVQLVDVMGRVLRSTDGACTVSTSGYAPGVYVLRLISGESVKTQKIVIR